jgi:hypothetical protein
MRIEPAERRQCRYKISLDRGHDRACSLGPFDRRPDPDLYRRRTPLVLDLGRAPHRIDGEDNAVGDAPRLDDCLALLTVDGEAHGEDGLQRVALLAARHRDVGLARRCPHRVVDDRGDRLGVDAATGEIRDNDLSAGQADRDRGRDPGFLGLVDGVVGQLLEDDQRPFALGVADELGEFPLRGELGEARYCERLARERRRRHRLNPSRAIATAFLMSRRRMAKSPRSGPDRFEVLD